MSSRHDVRPEDCGQVVAVDNGIWLDALFFGGSSEDLVRLAIMGRVRLLTSETLLAQLGLVLARRLAFSEPAVAQVFRFVRECSDVLPDAGANGSEAVHPTLEVASRGQATAIVITQRSRLSHLGEFQGIPIVSMS